MKILVNSHSFRDGLNKVLTVIDKKNTRPILSNSLIKTYDNYIEIIATDLEVSAKIRIQAKSSEEMTFCINTKNTFDILRELPEATIDLKIEKEKNLLNLSCENINYTLLLVDEADYPQTSFQKSGNEFNLSSKQVLNILSKVSYSVSTDETRINLNGIYFQKLESKLRAVAIDGHRLALVDIHNFNFENQSLTDGIIVPKKGLTELKKIAETYPDSSLYFSTDDSFMHVQCDENYHLSIRLIAREYPKYQAVIPNKTNFSMTVDRNKLFDAVKRIRILSNEKTNGIKFSISESELKLYANHPSLGHASESIPVRYSGDALDIGFNARYLMDALSALDFSELVFEFNNQLNPVIIKTEEFVDFLGIIMPLKI